MGNQNSSAGSSSSDQKDLIPARKLVETNKAHFPNESAEYRKARNELLVDEIELRRTLERVAAKRRALPPGGEVTKEYQFEGEQGASVTLNDLFGKHDTLIIYSYMLGPKREKPCPMCTSFMGTWDKKMQDIEQRASFVMTARSPIARLVAAKKERGWTNIKVFSDGSGEYTRDYVSKDDEDIPGFAVFKREKTDGSKQVIRHFYSGETSGEMADPNQDPRGAPDLDPLWILLDMTPEGRGKDWYPKLSY